MNLAESLADYLENDLSIATLGQDLFISRGPKKPSSQWLIRVENPNPTARNVTGEVTMPVTFSIYYRNTSAKAVYDQLEALADSLACGDCVRLTGYEVVDSEVIGPFIDQDIDDAERTVGLLQVTLRLYKG